jgi:branched-chain amino acid transport system permease protein
VSKAPLLRNRAGQGSLSVLAWILLVVVFALGFDDYYAGVGSSTALLAMLGLSMVLVIGYAGQFSLAVAAFYGAGAYGSMLLTTKTGLWGLLALVIAAVVSGVVAFAIARPLFRLRGHFLAMATLAIGEIFYLTVNNSTSLGASSGLGGIGSLKILGYMFATTRSQFVLDWLVVGALLWGALQMRRGRDGRALRAIRGHEAAAQAAGINVPMAKAQVFTVAAVVSSLAGSLYAHQVMYVDPPTFGVDVSIQILMLAVVGGMQTPWGAVVGAIVLEVLQLTTQKVLPGLFGDAGVGAGQQLIVGLILVAILVLRPNGLADVGRMVGSLLARRTASGAVEREIDADGDDMTTLRRKEDALPPKQIGETVLAAAGLVKRFGGVTAVDDVTLELGAGEVLAVIGPNGAGKSTLVNLLSGNLVPTSGEISIAGADVTRLQAHQIARRGLARTFQTPSLFEGMSTLETVAVGAHLTGRVGMMRSSLPTVGAVHEERRIEQEARDALARLGLEELAGLDAKSLSLGQQKRIEVARALVAEPKILLLDEPCAGLNKAEKRELMLFLRAIAREGVAVLLIEHDMEFVMAVADRVQVINFGATLRVGTPAEVQADPAVIDAYLGVAHDANTGDEKKVDA